MNARHPRAGLEGRPVILTATDDQVLDRIGAIAITTPGATPETARYVPAGLYLDACDQWEAWHRTAALIGAWRHRVVHDDTWPPDADLHDLDVLLDGAGLTPEQGAALNEVITQARQGRLRIGPNQ